MAQIFVIKSFCHNSQPFTSIFFIIQSSHSPFPPLSLSLWLQFLILFACKTCFNLTNSESCRWTGYYFIYPFFMARRLSVKLEVWEERIRKLSFLYTSVERFHLNVVIKFMKILWEKHRISFAVHSRNVILFSNNNLSSLKKALPRMKVSSYLSSIVHWKMSG